LGALGFIIGAAGCFHLAYAPAEFNPFRLAIIGYAICLAQLARLKTTRQSFYAGLIAAFLCIAPQLLCFWNIFGPGAVVLWLILALWIGAFTGMLHATLARLGTGWTAALTPFIWMGLEYFRSELYYLKFSWLNVGYAFFGMPLRVFGMYGMGFLAAICAGLFLTSRRSYAVIATIVLALWTFSLSSIEFYQARDQQIHIAGVQMEFPDESSIPKALDALVAEHLDADLLVLSEYSVLGPVPQPVLNWCRDHHRYLVIGAEDPAPNHNFYDTAFVIGPDGNIVFRQGKSVPIQFFKDGLPAPSQKVWDSPWGKIGFCVCYDLSYTRVIDPLVKQGAQLLIVPTMDVADWGARQHQLHALVAPVRAAECRLPIFRLASSGISQAVSETGNVIATAPLFGEGKTIYATLNLSSGASLPLDRFLAPVAVAVTAIVLLAVCIRKPKQNIPESEKIPSEPTFASETSSASKPG
jgi:apolipoprotein N-acyltransferase